MERKKERSSQYSDRDFGSDRVKGLGEMNPGIAWYNKEPSDEGMSEKSKWSSITDMSVSETMSKVRGEGTSYQMNEKEDRRERRENREESRGERLSEKY